MAIAIQNYYSQSEILKIQYKVALCIKYIKKNLILRKKNISLVLRQNHIQVNFFNMVISIFPLIILLCKF